MKDLKRFKHFGKPQRKYVQLYEPYGIEGFEVKYDQFDWNKVNIDYADYVCDELIVSNTGLDL